MHMYTFIVILYLLQLYPQLMADPPHQLLHLLH